MERKYTGIQNYFIELHYLVNFNELGSALSLIFIAAYILSFCCLGKVRCQEAAPCPWTSWITSRSALTQSVVHTIFWK